MYKPALVGAALFGFIGVALGALGAHALKPQMVDGGALIWEKGVQFHFIHTLAILATGMLFASYPFRSLKAAFVFFALGILMFSGSLYGLALLRSYPSFFPVLTPLGGSCFLAGWALLLVGILKKK